MIKQMIGDQEKEKEEEEEKEKLPKRNFLSMKKPKYLRKLSRDEYVVHRLRSKFKPPEPIVSLADKVVQQELKVQS